MLFWCVDLESKLEQHCYVVCTAVRFVWSATMGGINEWNYKCELMDGVKI